MCRGVLGPHLPTPPVRVLRSTRWPLRSGAQQGQLQRFDQRLRQGLGVVSGILVTAEMMRYALEANMDSYNAMISAC